MNNKEKKAKKLDRRARVVTGRANNQKKKPKLKKDKPTPRNPQKPNKLRRKARLTGTKNAWGKFRRILRK